MLSFCLVSLTFFFVETVAVKDFLDSVDNLLPTIIGSTDFIYKIYFLYDV